MASAEPVTLVGQSETTWRVFEPGVSWTENTTSNLRISLTVKADGRASLLVRGHRTIESSFRTADGSGDPERSSHEVDDRWSGRLRRGDPARLEIRERDEDEAPAQVYRCARDDIGGSEIPRVRCTPTIPNAGEPWEDPLPAYLRLPLVLGRGQPVHTWISGEQGQAPSVYVADEA